MKQLTGKILWMGASLLSLGAFGQSPQNSMDTFAQSQQDSMNWSENVGWTGTERVVLPVNQAITPAGKEIELHGLRPQVLALSPDGKILVTSGKTIDVVVLDPATGRILQKVALPNDGPLTSSPAPASTHYLKPDPDEQVSYTGLVFSPDGSHLYLSNEKGSIKVFAVDSNHHLTGIGSISLPDANAPERKEEIPSGLAISANGKRLYVAGSLSNHLLEYELPDGKLLGTFDTGEVPYTVVLAGHKAYVSNWAGRVPDTNSLTGWAGQGTKVRVDSRDVASEGSVSVIDLNTGKNVTEVMTGLHPTAMVVTPNGEYVCVANANSDTVSVISTATDKVMETIPVRWQSQDLFGASPNALAMDHSGKTLYVCDGTQNAVSVIAFHPGQSKFLGLVPYGKYGNSKMLGLIPTGWFPGAIVYNHQGHQLYVANIKGTLPGPNYDPGRVGYNSHEHLGTVLLIPLPTKSELQQDTIAVFRNYRRAVEQTVFEPARPGQPPRPVPERIGEPCVFEHVIYLIKENRTYDQVLGDVKEGNGDIGLCTFRENVTPNQHKFVHDFVLMDNMYCCGILSADGHEWADTALATDYMEKSFADFPRSYPDLQDPNDFDAIAYSPAGFIWNDAVEHGKTFINYGEGTWDAKVWKDPNNKKPIDFPASYNDFIAQRDSIQYTSIVGLNFLAPYTMTNDMVGWDLEVPDVYRAAVFKRELKRFEAEGKMPNLIIMDLPQDHTSGTDPGEPTPSAMAADNDLGFGQIVDAVSHSPFWTNTCIFACEDDPQSGWDHVSGYRTTAYVISPYTKRHTVIHINYNQTGILRTMELMLGLPPMNQMDATATPMTACFTDQPDFTPYDCVTNNIPLDQLNPALTKISDRRQYHDALISSRLPFEKADQCPDAVLNLILWHAQMGFNKPYPTWAITETGDD
ncbi:MAG TPA: bifunctional YncE family protein/alkaline phosphatase family protein [Pseudomonadales bacterium]|nr:bifunctional YncE family protein/alkaline phosphatase family protein [Pseudomonadales bacterium]